jgi:hypothetical protein
MSISSVLRLRVYLHEFEAARREDSSSRDRRARVLYRAVLRLVPRTILELAQ